ncbi:MAG: single-stranded DNA-binding protein [Patescibacteria group bacterium]
MNLNKVILIGRLTQEPEARSTPSGQSVTTLRMATNRTWNDQASGQRKEAVEYHTVIAWGRLGEIASQYLRRGGLLMIEGRLQTRNWTGNDNVKRYMTEIIAENLQLGPRSATEGSASYQSSAPASDRAPAAPAPVDDIPIIDENDLPAQAGMTHQGVDEQEVKIKEEDLPF